MQALPSARVGCAASGYGAHVLFGHGSRSPTCKGEGLLLFVCFNPRVLYCDLNAYEHLYKYEPANNRITIRVFVVVNDGPRDGGHPWRHALDPPCRAAAAGKS